MFAYDTIVGTVCNSFSLMVKIFDAINRVGFKETDLSERAIVYVRTPTQKYQYNETPSGERGGFGRGGWVKTVRPNRSIEQKFEIII